MSSALDKLAKRAKAIPASPLVGGREVEIPLEKIRFDPSQPRKAFHPLDGQIAEKDDAYIVELSETIKARGLIQAITVQEMDDGTYLVVVGECRTRAHLLLGLPTIRAVVRNDLTNMGQRLLYQIAENVNRQDLSDDELAGSIRALIKGGNGLEPMSQVQIAKTLGKTEGWVSRLMRFGDEEQQRLWVKTGIASTTENVYRLAILPKAIQVDILRRVELPEGHPERLLKPLDRKLIDDFSREAKIYKNAGKLSPSVAVGPSPVSNVPAPADKTQAPLDDGVDTRTQDWINPAQDAVQGDLPRETGEAAMPNVSPDADGMGQALGALVVEGHAASASSAAPSKQDSAVLPTGGYELPADMRAAIVGSMPPAPSKEAAAEMRQAQAPVNCRVSLVDVLTLLNELQSNQEVRSAVDHVQCELFFPSNVAQLIANHLAGVVVDRREVPAVLQRELTKLR